MSRNRFWPAIAIFLLAANPSLAAQTVPDITGQFRIARSGMILAIATCDHGALCGRIAGLGSLAPTDANNPVPELQARRLCGAAVLERLEWQSAGVWRGVFYDPQNGSNYAVALAPAGTAAMRVTGYSGQPVLSRTYKRPVEVWERVPSPAATCDAPAVTS